MLSWTVLKMRWLVAMMDSGMAKPAVACVVVPGHPAVREQRLEAGVAVLHLEHRGVDEPTRRKTAAEADVAESSGGGGPHASQAYTARKRSQETQHRKRMLT